MGAALGGLAGFAAPFLDYQICVLVGMGALVASVIGAPIATILIVFELTENYQAATAVMLGVVAANALVTRYYARSIFHRQILRRGIDMNRPREQRLMAARQIAEVMSPQFLGVAPECTVAELRHLVHDHQDEVYVVAGEEQRLLGIIPMSKLVSAEDSQTAVELCNAPAVVLLTTDNLWKGFLAIEEFIGYSMPVVHDRESMRMAGAVTEGDLVAAYRAAVTEVRQD